MDFHADFRSWLGSFHTFVSGEQSDADKTNDKVAKSNRLKIYGRICVLGLAAVCFGGIGDVLKLIYGTNKNHGYYCLIYFTFSLVIMLMGFVGAAFPESSLMHTFIAGLGAWQAMVLVSLLATLRSGVLYYVPTPEYAIYLMMATSVPFILYWGLIANDLQVVLWLKSLAYQAGIWIQAKGIMLTRKLVEHWHDAFLGTASHGKKFTVQKGHGQTASCEYKTVNYK